MAPAAPRIQRGVPMTDPAPPTIQALLEQHEWVRRLARRLVGDPHEADDLAQEALAVALERPPQDACPCSRSGPGPIWARCASTR